MVRYRRHRKGRAMRSVDRALSDSSAQFRYMFGDLNIFGIQPFKMYDSMNYMNDYLKNRNLSWSDMKYPSLSFGAGGAGSSFSSNTKAIERMYGIKTPYEPPNRETPWYMYG